jgi:hypothetical protein
MRINRLGHGLEMWVLISTCSYPEIILWVYSNLQVYLLLLPCQAGFHLQKIGWLFTLVHQPVIPPPPPIPPSMLKQNEA